MNKITRQEVVNELIEMFSIDERVFVKAIFLNWYHRAMEIKRSDSETWLIMSGVEGRLPLLCRPLHCAECGDLHEHGRNWCFLSLSYVDDFEL